MWVRSGACPSVGSWQGRGGRGSSRASKAEKITIWRASNGRPVDAEEFLAYTQGDIGSAEVTCMCESNST